MDDLLFDYGISNCNQWGFHLDWMMFQLRYISQYAINNRLIDQNDKAMDKFCCQ